MDINTDFKQLLTDFFKIYHPRQVKKIEMIVAEFPNQKEEVMVRLCDKYKVAQTRVKGLTEALAAKQNIPAAPQPEVIEENVSDEVIVEVDEEEVIVEEEVEEGKKKKKKK